MIGKYASGNLLLKVLVRESHLDTNATTSWIITQLSSLDEYTMIIGSDIGRFNFHVQTLMGSLAARGETSTDLLTIFFKRYAECSDKTFVTYMDRKQEDYEDGKDTTPKQTMQTSDSRFKNQNLKNKWNVTSAEEEKILSLQAELKVMKRATKDGKKRKDNPKKRRGKR